MRQEASDVDTPGNLFAAEGLKVKPGMSKAPRLIWWDDTCFYLVPTDFGFRFSFTNLNDELFLVI